MERDKQMKIGIVGNYGNDNQGDESVLEGIIIQLENAYPIERKDILVFSNNLKQTRERYGTDAAPLFIDRKTDPMKFIATLLHHRKIVSSFDLLIIGGGGILMDLYRSNPFVFGIYGLLVKWTRVPAAVFGVGVGPIRSFFGKKFIKMIGNAVQTVTVRDRVSKKLLEDIGVKTPINVTLDPAFYLHSKGEKKTSAKATKIGVTALPYFHDSYWPTRDDEKYNGYIEGMAANLDNILDKEPNGTVQFFSTKHPYDTNTTKDIRQLMKHKERANVYDELLTHQEIMSLIAEQDLVIGTRLHSLILSIVTKTPIIAVGYHDKVRDVMEAVHCKESTLTISEVSKDHQCILPIYEALNNNWESTLEKFDTMADELIQESTDGMDKVKSIYTK